MLKLEALELYNWCNLQGTRKIDFEDNFNVINGKNGGGKTSIVNAISMLLLNKYDGNLEGFINNECIEASAELHFSINNSSYISGIKLKKSKGTSSERSLIQDGIEIAKGEDCEKKLNEILPSHITNYSLIYRQGEDGKITECSDSERRDILTQLVSLDYSNKIEQFILPTIDTLNNTISEVEKEIYSLENKSYNFREEKQVSGTKYSQSEIEAISAKVELWKNNEANVAKQIKIRQDIDTAAVDLNLAKSKYNIENLEQNEKVKIQELKEAISKQLEELQNVKASAKEASKTKMQSYLDTCKDLESSLARITFKEIPDFDKNLVTEKSSFIASLEAQRSIAEKNCKSLETGVCPVCGGNCEHKLQDFQKQLEDLNAQLSTVKQELEIAKVQENSIQQLESENNDLKTKQINLQAELSTTKAKIEGEKTNIVNLLQSYKEKENILNEKLESDILNIQNSTKTQIEASKEIIEQKQKYLDNLQQQLSEIKVVDNLEDCRETLSSMLSKNSEIDECIAYNKAVQEQNKATLEQQTIDETTKSELSSKLINLKNQLADNKLSVEIMSKTYPTWKLERDLKEIENRTNIFIEDVYKPLFVRFTAKKNSLQMTYGADTSLEEKARDLPVKRLSGAEKQIVNLAVENIFNQQQNLSCLILDEPDSAMDINNKETFFNSLISLQNYYKQIIVITHSREMKDKLAVEGANTIML